jgi:hypothetical protein
MRRRPSASPEGIAVIDIDEIEMLDMSGLSGMGDTWIRERRIEGPERLWGEQARADTKMPGEPPGDRVLAII